MQPSWRIILHCLFQPKSFFSFDRFGAFKQFWLCSFFILRCCCQPTYKHKYYRARDIYYDSISVDTQHIAFLICIMFLYWYSFMVFFRSIYRICYFIFNRFFLLPFLLKLLFFIFVLNMYLCVLHFSSMVLLFFF